ncbi:PIG-L family deacetylase [Georgenia sp. AZ-5]|uniref:PIG-L family deacetylase n=1 Tax=Georgenia sp. AZ-5 TaxID=3367526 RepID=UPI0037548FA5
MTSTRDDGVATGGLLGVFAHPNDETLGAGGLLASAARARVPVTVVTATRGELGDVIPRELMHLKGDHVALAHERERELARACARLGARAPVFLDRLPGLAGQRPARFTDSGMVWLRTGVAGPLPDAGPDALSNVPVEVAARLLAALVRRTRPQVVVTEEPHGSYGHPDHVHAHQVTMRAVELAGDAAPFDAPDDPLVGTEPWQVPVVVWVVESEPRFRAALRWLEQVLARRPLFGVRGDALATIPADGEMPSLVYPPSKVDLTIDTTPVLPAVVAALRAHRTQVQNVHLVERDEHDRDAPAHGWYAVTNGLLLPLTGTASLHLAPGFDRVEELTVEPVHHAWTDPIPLSERYGPLGVVGLAGLDVKDRLAGRAGAARLAAFLGGTMLG